MTLATLWDSLSKDAGFFYTIGSAILVAGAVVAAVRATAIFRAAVSGVTLVAMLEVKDARIKEVLRERDEVKDALSVALTANEGWRAAVEQIASEVRDLKTQVSDLRHRLGTSTRYISDLLLYIKRADLREDPPVIPEELADDIDFPPDIKAITAQ